MKRREDRASLPLAREFPCPTCEATTGNPCVSMGGRGSEKGKPMPTAVHTARSALVFKRTGTEPQPEPATKTTSRRAKGARKAWRTRRKRFGKGGGATGPHSKSQPVLNLGLETLTSHALELIRGNAELVEVSLVTTKNRVTASQTGSSTVLTIE